eukprot:SAG22_NODE_104_length_20159_cov_5.877517_30_plen_58_part_00
MIRETSYGSPLVLSVDHNKLLYKPGPGFHLQDRWKVGLPTMNQKPQYSYSTIIDQKI